jgi:hypothetical protein
MNLLPCPIQPQEQEESARSLPREIVHEIEALRQERIRNYTEHVRSELPAARTGLEQNVDNLLDALHNLHRLEQLAACVANGGQITVEADRNLIASNEETYRMLLERYSAESPHARAVVSSLLPSTPRPIESDTLA